MNRHSPHKVSLGLLIAASLACNSLNTAGPSARPLTSNDAPVVHPNLVQVVPTQASVVPTASSVILHAMQPAEVPPEPGKMIDDVESSGTGPEGRAPYGDSYKYNRFERPFLQNMTYVSDMDIHRFGLSQDTDWYYVSILLIGNNPNNVHGINYGVEIDPDADGFGEYIVWAQPPFINQWDTTNVQVFEDSNNDSAGGSAASSDAGSNGDGYESLIFDGGSARNADLDLAWVRWLPGEKAIVQFAFKKSWAGSAFLLGVVADAGLRDVSRYDYNDYMTITEAGSPVRDHANFPLGALYAVDNTCWEAHGLQITGLEPKACKPIVPVVKTPSDRDSDDESGQSAACAPPVPVEEYCGTEGSWSTEICDCVFEP